ncbi:MAG: solute-binding protein [Planctomycetaceae bacterium]|nr:solute-binding protein [Planctomycetaceae bacterium]
MRFSSCLLLAVLSLFPGGCSEQTIGTGQPATGNSHQLRLATTTSTRDSGLLDELIPKFQAKYDCQVTVIAVGTGAALKLGQRGEVDVLIVHAPAAEQAFMRAGHGVTHQSFMENYFVILGPANDPANIKDKPPLAAFEIIANRYWFASRGDDSGTHKKEIGLWKDLGSPPPTMNYLETGQGMANTLLIAEEKQAYVLTDRATYLRFNERLTLIPLTSPHPALKNRYSVITVTPTKNDMINQRQAIQLAEFLVSSAAQKTISEYKIQNQTLFNPLTPSTK